MAAFEAGELERACQALARSLASAPRWNRARFDLARTLSRLGRLEEAAEHLEVVLRADLPGYLQRTRVDPDLQKLRDAGAVLGLNAMIAGLKARWTEALAEGWPTIDFQAAADVMDGEPPEFYPKHSVRAGVFVPGTERFLPVGEIVSDVDAVLIDAATRRVLNLRADATVDLFSQMFNVSWRIEPWLPESPSATVFGVPDEEDADFAAINVSLGSGTRAWRFYETFEDLSAPDRALSGERKVTLHVLGEGTLLLSPAPPGVRLSGNQLFLSDRPMARLSRRHALSRYHSFVEADGGLYVASTQYGCDISNRSGLPVPVQRHVVDYVDTAAGTVTAVSEGPGTASALVFPGGRVALQRGQRVDVLEPGTPGLDHAWRLPEGQLLHVPLRRKNCVYH